MTKPQKNGAFARTLRRRGRRRHEVAEVRLGSTATRERGLDAQRDRFDQEDESPKTAPSLSPHSSLTRFGGDELEILQVVGKGFYMKSIRDMIQGKRRRLIVGVDDIRNYSLDLARRLILSPAEYILPISDALTEVTRNVDPKYLKEGERVLVGFSGQFGSRKITPRDLISSFIGSMVCVEGIVTKCTLTCALS
ncbi:hypothetical protein BHE74_00002739 [Ensete ventricosum]|nr:hypothetical protein GW17_00002181 [Ensete ventricosum]RWW88385.1 hypothetical protein BHE74_00002739 [Ensete ventricosum]